MQRMHAALVAGAILAAGPAPAMAAERDLGTHRLDGGLDLAWTVLEATGSGQWIGAYTIRGDLAEVEAGEEALLAGWSISCEGVMNASGRRIEHDAGTCRLESPTGQRFAARFAVEAGVWGRSALRIAFSGGTGVYRTLRGEGEVERLMYLPPDASSGWGYLTGTVRWHRD